MKSVFDIVLKNRRKKGDSVRMEWPKIIQAPGYNTEGETSHHPGRHQWSYL